MVGIDRSDVELAPGEPFQIGPFTAVVLARAVSTVRAALGASHITIDDPKAYTKPWTVRVDFRIRPEEELIEFICNENQQFRKLIKID